MVYDHAVKFNGEYYPAGVEIPEPIEETISFPHSDSEAEAEVEPVKKGRPKKNN